MAQDVSYHLFSDNYDEWYATLETAQAAYRELCKEAPNVRLYECVSDEDSDFVEENYLDGQGEFPW